MSDKCSKVDRKFWVLGKRRIYSQARKAIIEVKQYSSPYNRLLRPTEDVEVQLYSFFNVSVRRGEW